MKRLAHETNLRIKDLHTASFLVASGLSIGDVEREGKICYFVFPNREKALQLHKDYWAGTAMIKAKAFSDAIRSLKDILFSLPT